jgi:hypothetical protein
MLGFTGLGRSQQRLQAKKEPKNNCKTDNQNGSKNKDDTVFHSKLKTYPYIGSSASSMMREKMKLLLREDETSHTKSREPSYATRAMVLLLFCGEERSTRCRQRRGLALPYMLLLLSFSRFTGPSSGPLLHGSVNPASTAALSCWMPRAMDFSSGNVLASTELSQVSHCCPVCARIICMKAGAKR